MAHGGRITVQSRKGRGTTFTVLLRAQPPLLGNGERSGSIRRLPAQRSPMRAVSSKPSPRPTFPAYWQDRLATSQMKVPSLPRAEMDVAPTSTMTSPSLTAYLKTSWPARTRKSNEASAVRSSVAQPSAEDEQELRRGERARQRAVERPPASTSSTTAVGSPSPFAAHRFRLHARTARLRVERSALRRIATVRTDPIIAARSMRPFQRPGIRAPGPTACQPLADSKIVTREIARNDHPANPGKRSV